MSTSKRQPKISIMDKLMAEHVEMPGFPQIVVTRDFVYQFLRGCGWYPCERGFGSLDYMTFGRKAVDAPLTDEGKRDQLMADVRDSYLRESEAVQAIEERVLTTLNAGLDAAVADVVARIV